MAYGPSSMMATTHAFAGLAIAAGVATVAPAYAMVAAISGLIGGIFPDLDVLATHRRTLHLPTLYAIGTIIATGLAVMFPTATTVALAVGIGAALLHTVSELFGGGVSLRPWREHSTRGVYFHLRGQWIAPREWVRYDGAPEDLLLSVLLAIPGWLVFPQLHGVIIGGLVISVLYTVLRKPIGRRLATNQ